MHLPPNPTPQEIQAALGPIRVKIRAGLIPHDQWPPPADMPAEHRAVLLDRLAEEVLTGRRGADA